MTNENANPQNRKPIIALDLGTRFVGVSVCDERHITIKPLPPLRRTNWKQLLRDVETLVKRFDAEGLVLGLPLNLDGSMGTSAEEITRLASNFSKSLKVPVFLQDERLTSVEARQKLISERHDEDEIGRLIDGEAAALILRDYLVQTDSV
jgi:putative Holliday junction resolvase